MQILADSCGLRFEFGEEDEVDVVLEVELDLGVVLSDPSDLGDQSLDQKGLRQLGPDGLLIFDGHKHGIGLVLLDDPFPVDLHDPLELSQLVELSEELLKDVDLRLEIRELGPDLSQLCDHHVESASDSPVELSVLGLLNGDIHSNCNSQRGLLHNLVNILDDLHHLRHDHYLLHDLFQNVWNFHNPLDR